MLEEHQLLENFIAESLEMVQKAAPFARALIEQPDQEDILLKMQESCLPLLRAITGRGGVLHLKHLTAPAEAVECLLDRVRAGLQTLTPQHISLLVEFCRFLEEGLPLVLSEKSDKRLAPVAKALTSAILQSIKTNDFWGYGTGPSASAEVTDSLLEETRDLLATVEQEFVLWDFIALDHDRVTELCRRVLRLQRNFALLELKDLERLCLALTGTLQWYLQGAFFQTEYPERVFLRSIDAVRDTMTHFVHLEDAAVRGLEHHLAALQGLIRKPIGALLVEAGLVAPQVLEKALEVQESMSAPPRRLGEVLVEMGEVTSAQVRHILQEQQNGQTRAMQAEAELERIRKSRG